MTFGEKLQRLRKERGVSQETLAAELGVSRQAISRWELGEVVPDTANVLAVSRRFGVSTDYLLLDECDAEGETPAARTAERSLKERQAAVGQGFLCRVLWLALISLYHQYRLDQAAGGTPPVPLWWLLVLELAVGVWTWRLNWRYGVKEGGSFRALLVPDLLALACAFGLPFFLEWVPGRWGIFLGQLAAILCLVFSIKTLRLHYGLPWRSLREKKPEP